MTYFHFTHFLHLPSILADGRLATTESNIGAPGPVPDGPTGSHVGPPVVWLFDTPEPDWFGEKAHGLYPDKRAIRFEVEVRAIRWLDWPYRGMMSPSWREAFERSAGGEEAAEHWRVWPAPIRSRRWRSVVDLRTGEPVADWQ